MLEAEGGLRCEIDERVLYCISIHDPYGECSQLCSGLAEVL